QVGSACGIDEECSSAVTNSYCAADGACKCKFGYYSANGGAECRPLEIGEGSCSSDTECTAKIPSSECANGRCRCRVGYLTSEDKTQCIKR
ncbi:hypothetical protein CAPTEDRAFT_29836, partial [Capitella teleta]